MGRLRSGRGSKVGAAGSEGEGTSVSTTLDHDEARALVKQGQENGYLTHEEVALALDDLGLDTQQLDRFYQELDELQIEVLDEAPADEPAAPAANEVSTDALQLFLKDIGRVPLLTAAQEVELAKRIERGDHAAKQAMVEANLRLVVSIAKR